MSIRLAALAGLAGIGLFAAAPQASAMTALGGAKAPAVQGSIEQVHGLHRTCRPDRYGWHRSRPWGRSSCGSASVWIWRCADGHCGSWHRNEHRWRDGWNGGRGKHREHGRRDR